MNARQAFLTRDSIADLLRLGSLVAIAVGLFAIVIAGIAIYLNLSAQLELERSDRAASQQADRIAGELSDIQTSLRDVSVVDAARSGSLESLRAALRARDVVNLLDIRLLPSDIDEIAVGQGIELNMAETDAVIEAIRNERADIRVLQPGTPSESLVFAQRMPGDTGVLLLRLTVSIVASLLRDNEMLDFVALAQQDTRSSTLLASRGGSATTTVRNIPIAGSSLVLQWHRAVAQSPADNRTAVILGSSGVIVMMIGLLLRRRTRLAHYLDQFDAKTPHRAESRKPPAAKPAGHKTPRAAGHQGGTLVLFPDNLKTNAAPEQAINDDEPPTMVARSPDLPQWLRDDFDSIVDELSPPAPFPGPDEDTDVDADNELLDDFKAYQGVDPSLFKADGIYGKAGSDLTVPDMVILGQAIASEAVERGLRRICIAHDGRPSGPELLGGLVQGLSVSGVDVVELGAVPAPLAWFAAMRRQKAGGVMVTGGEKPEAVNGLEIVFDGLWLDREDRRTLLDRIRNQEFATGAGERIKEDEVAAYIERITANHHIERPLRVVADCGNAVNAAVVVRLLAALGAEAIPLNADGGTDPAEVAGFESAERIEPIKLYIDKLESDLGIVFDRTGSRLRVVGPDGGVVEPARLSTMLSDDAGSTNSEWHNLPDAFHAAAVLLARLAAGDKPAAEILCVSGQETNKA